MSELLALKSAIKTEAFRLGFSHFGVAPALPVSHIAEFKAWIANEFHANMAYLAREDTLAKRSDPRLILNDCQTVICLALPYDRPVAQPAIAHAGQGRVSAYARTVDYHQTIWKRLAQLATFIHTRTDQKTSLKSYVDTGPILERSYATEAGLGIAGKHTCLIIRKAGTYFFLAEILTNLDLPPDKPETRDLCGSCQRCLEACPTSCIQPDRTIDASRCISTLTIEQRGIIPDEKKSLLGDRVFGCDACQMACPHNSQPSEFPITLGEHLIPEFLDLIDLLRLDQAGFKTRFETTPIYRSKREGLLRNAAIVLGNQQYSPALPTLHKCLEEETDVGLLDACQWAIREIEGSSTKTCTKETSQ